MHCTVPFHYVLTARSQPVRIRFMCVGAEITFPCDFPHTVLSTLLLKYIETFEGSLRSSHASIILNNELNIAKYIAIQQTQSFNPLYLKIKYETTKGESQLLKDFLKEHSIFNERTMTHARFSRRLSTILNFYP